MTRAGLSRSSSRCRPLSPSACTLAGSRSERRTRVTALLGGLGQRASGGEVEPVEVVEGRDAEEASEPRPHQVGTLALGEVDRRQALRAEVEAVGEGLVAKPRTDDAPSAMMRR